jgi:hypothetical protein
VTAEGRAALLRQNLGDGLVKFELRNLSAGTRCEVNVKYAFTASSTDLNSIIFKFLLDACTSHDLAFCVTSSVLDLFHFSVRSLHPSAVSAMTANICGCYDASKAQFVVSAKHSGPRLLSHRRCVLA